MSEERNTRREILKKVLTLGPLAALAGAFGGNGPKPAQAATYNEDVRINGNLAVMPGASPAGPGNVGIGTAGPDSVLSIKDPGDGIPIIRVRRNTTGEAGNLDQIRMVSSGGGTNYRWLDIGMNIVGGGATDHAYAYFNVGNNATEGMSAVTPLVLHTSGNVGIGTTSPDSVLSIKDPGDGIPIIRVRRTTTGAAGNLDQIRMVSGSSGGGINYRWLDIGMNIVGGGATDHAYAYFSVGNNATEGIGGVVPLVLHTNGNVGIGTTSPVAKLDVVGDIRLTGSVLPVGGGVFEGKARRSYYDT